MERVMGIEPTPSAWKAEVLPLNYTRAEVVEGVGFEPTKAKASRFTVCPRWPLGYPSADISRLLSFQTCTVSISRLVNFATVARRELLPCSKHHRDRPRLRSIRSRMSAVRTSRPSLRSDRCSLDPRLGRKLEPPDPTRGDVVDREDRRCRRREPMLRRPAATKLGNASSNAFDVGNRATPRYGQCSRANRHSPYSSFACARDRRWPDRRRRCACSRARADLAARG